MYHTPPIMTICKLQKPEKAKTDFFGALVPRLTSEVRRGSCLTKVPLYEYHQWFILKGANLWQTTHIKERISKEPWTHDMLLQSDSSFKGKIVRRCLFRMFREQLHTFLGSGKIFKNKAPKITLSVRFAEFRLEFSQNNFCEFFEQIIAQKLATCSKLRSKTFLAKNAVIYAFFSGKI